MGSSRCWGDADAEDEDGVVVYEGGEVKGRAGEEGRMNCAAFVCAATSDGNGRMGGHSSYLLPHLCLRLRNITLTLKRQSWTPRSAGGQTKGSARHVELGDGSLERLALENL